MSFQSGPLPIDPDDRLLLSPISEHFGNVDHHFIRRVFRERAQTLANSLSNLITLMQRGEIQRRVFVRQSMRALQQTYFTVFSLGALSVDPFHILTDDDIDVIQSELLGERKFLQSFARDLDLGLLDLPVESRARLYLAALRGMFELGHIAALPDRPYVWVLGDTDHCEPCLFAAENGPYKKNERSRLDLPVLPGIPGSGEVCRGLTRCGCTVKRPEFPAGEALQLQLRDILASITVELP